MSDNKLEYNKKSLGKRVFCVYNKGFYGTIVDVQDEGHFVIRDDFGKEQIISIYDIRYINEQHLP